VTDRLIARVYIGQPPWVGKHDLIIPAHLKRLARHWIWRCGFAFGGITTFTAMQLGPVANGVYLTAIFLAGEAALRLDRAPAKGGTP